MLRATVQALAHATYAFPRDPDGPRDFLTKEPVSGVTQRLTIPVEGNSDETDDVFVHFFIPDYDPAEEFLDDKSKNVLGRIRRRIPTVVQSFAWDEHGGPLYPELYIEVRSPDPSRVPLRVARARSGPCPAHRPLLQADNLEDYLQDKDVYFKNDYDEVFVYHPKHPNEQAHGVNLRDVAKYTNRHGFDNIIDEMRKPRGRKGMDVLLYPGRFMVAERDSQYPQLTPRNKARLFPVDESGPLVRSPYDANVYYGSHLASSTPRNRPSDYAAQSGNPTGDAPGLDRGDPRLYVY